MAKTNKKTTIEIEPSTITYIAVGIGVGLILLVGGYIAWSGITLSTEEEAPSVTSEEGYVNPAADAERRRQILDELSEDTESWETYINEERNITFRYPSSWSIETDTIDATVSENGESDTEPIGRITGSKEEYSFMIYSIDSGMGGEDYCFEAADLELPSDLRDYIYNGEDFTFVVGYAGDYVIKVSPLEGNEELAQAFICLDEWYIGDFLNNLAAGEPILARFPVGNPNPDTLTEMYTIIATYEQVESTRGVRK